MGIDVAEVSETPPSHHAIKVHRLMCMELIQLVSRVSILLPEIEAARPRCLEALSLLNTEIFKTKTLIQHCSESSKLYLALTGAVILSRCDRSRNLLKQSLGQVQNMVPVSLASEISRLIAELKGAIFSLDPSEEEAGKVVMELLHQYVTTDSAEEHAFEATQVAMRRLHITSLLTLLIEKRSIKRMLGRVGDGEKRKILLLFLNILSKHGKSVVTQQTESGSLQREDFYLYANQCEAKSRMRCRSDDAQVDILRSSRPPDEFKCPLSLRIMHDPVVIASGQTYDRFWIQKWFAEGHDTCPMNKRNLAHLSLTPNYTMKDLISGWSATHGVSVPDPSMEAAAAHSFKSSLNSIASLSSSVNDLRLPIEFSNLSCGSPDAGLVSVAKTPNDFDVVSGESNGSIHKIQSGISIQDMDLNLLTGFSSLSWESQCILVGDISNFFKHNDQACNWMSSEDFVLTMVRFLKDAHDFNDLNAQIMGCLTLTTVLQKCRSNFPDLNDDAFALLVSFLETEVSKEALAVLKVLSCHQYCPQKIVASGALTPILEMLDAQNAELNETAIKILRSLSENSRIVSLITPSEFIPKLIPFLEDTALASDTLVILKKLCITEDATTSVAEADGCIASVVKLLDSENREDQEHAVALLLSLCSQCFQYCRLAMDEGIILDLFNISVNGNSRGKTMALKLLTLLRGEFSNNEESSGADVDISRGSTINLTLQKSSSKAPGFLKKLFSKQCRA
ncbi:U-box domain-containing protein 5-like [Nicotiana tomentosiformis]|uniref:U-box domain-containing protein 5-like n=1 Tax=Nicotiana tomentosiformis TaxID=4098 RepID=UPI00051B30B1|nr:U-box domain-containing protein 5-like [Nicotiana tomentosiformis]XP_033511258.1 U-box domain-containing protein 5-like [Nicotiana tomentosiformis]